MTSKTEGPGTNTNMDVDYVISYMFGDEDKIKASSQFEQLIKTLTSVGLATEVRNGEKQTLLVFVKLASEQYLQEEIYRSRVRDWLHGVRTAAPDSSSKEQPLYPAERLRIVYQLITNPEDDGGAGVTAKHGEWKNVESIFALHNNEFNKGWLKKWATSYTLKPEDLDSIRDQFGEKVAFYFAFTQSYFMSLMGIAAFGASSWVLLGYFSPVYAVVNSLLCVVFVEYWKKQEFDLAVRWGVRGVSTIQNRRREFRAEKEIQDPVTGEKVLWFSGSKRLQRQLLQLPFAIVAASALGALIATCFAIEVFISEVYKGPGQGVLVFLPTGILTTMQPLILGLLTDFANRLTAFENYDTDHAHDTALTQKIFVLNFLQFYLPIFLTAFVYVPFAAHIVPYLDVFGLTVKAFANSDSELKTPTPANFQINPSRLRKQVIYFTVTAQIVNQAMEIVVPYFKRRGMNKYQEMQNARAAKKGASPTDEVTANDAPEEAAFLKRVRREASLDEYDVATDFREMVVQYGYLTLFSVVWPLTGVSFLVNNWLELRTDAAKICTETKRPTPWRADSIGPWLDSLGFLTWLGSITTAAIVYMFYGDASSGETANVASSGNIQIWALLLAIFASEHTYFLVSWGVRAAIGKLDSPGRQKERAERYMVRRKYLEEGLGGADALKGGKRSVPKSAGGDVEDLNRKSLEEEARRNGAAKMEERFWMRQRGWEECVKVGDAIIERGAEEGKKGR